MARELVSVVRSADVAWFRMVTLALGTTAPEESRTVPWMALVDCVQAAGSRTRKAAIARKKVARILNMIFSPKTKLVVGPLTVWLLLTIGSLTQRLRVPYCSSGV